MSDTSIKRNKALSRFFEDHVSLRGFTKEQEKKIMNKLEKDLSFEFDCTPKVKHEMDRENRKGKVKDRCRNELVA